MRRPNYGRAYNEAVGRRVRRLREARAWSLEQLAAALGEAGPLVTTSQLSKLERGAQTISAAWLYRLSEALQCPIVDLLTDNPIPLPSQMLATKIESLSEPDRATVAKVVDALSNQANATPEPAPETPAAAPRRRGRRR